MMFLRSSLTNALFFSISGELDPEKSTSGIQYGHLAKRPTNSSAPRRLVDIDQSRSKSCVLCQP